MSILDHNTLHELDSKYRGAKRVGWSVKGSRKKENQTIEVNREEILQVVQSACYADYLFERVYYGDRLLMAIAGRLDFISEPGSLSEFRKIWENDVFLLRTVPFDEDLIRAAREEFSGGKTLTPIEQAILYLLHLDIDKGHRETIMNALFKCLPRSIPAPRGRLRCMGCDSEADVSEILASGENAAYCARCGQKLI